MRRSNTRFHQYVPFLAHGHMYGGAYYYTSNALGNGASLSAVFWNAMAFHHIPFDTPRAPWHDMACQSCRFRDGLPACSPFHPTGESYVVYHRSKVIASLKFSIIVL